MTGRRRMWNVLRNSGGALTTRQVSAIAGTGRRDTQEYLKALAENGYLSVMTAKGGIKMYNFLRGGLSAPVIKTKGDKNERC